MTHISLGSDTAAPVSRRGATTPLSPKLTDSLDVRRRQTGKIADSIGALADACVALADRISAGGRLFVLGSGDALPDARHLALEFLHPVIVGKRAVAALAVAFGDRLGAVGDVLIAIPGSRGGAGVARALADARTRGLLTIAIAPHGEADDGASPPDHVLDPCAADAASAKEGRVILYHLLWELTHVLLEESERLAPSGADDDSRLGSDFGALYPFLGTDRKPPESLHVDLCASGRAKLHALSQLRDDTVRTHAASLASCATSLQRVFAAGGELFTFGNGGSQTDADWIATGLGSASDWRARSLASDPSVMSALANDVGFERVFARQIAAFGRSGDAALGISTSGSSGNVVDGLAEAKRKALVTIGLAGGEGGRMGQSNLDFLFVVASDSVHRIQEVQATLYHLLETLCAEDAAQSGGSECDS